MPIPIYLRTPDGSLSLVKCKKRRFTIGRNSDNDLVLDDESVMARHAMIEFINDNLIQVTNRHDLGGITIGLTHLSAGEKWDWGTDEVLNIGGHRFLWRKGAQAEGATCDPRMAREVKELFQPGFVPRSARANRWSNRFVAMLLLGFLFFAGVIVGAFVMLDLIASASEQSALVNYYTAGAQAAPLPTQTVSLPPPPSMPTPSATMMPVAPMLLPTVTPALSLEPEATTPANAEPPPTPVVRVLLPTPTSTPPAPVLLPLQLDAALVALGVTLEPVTVAAGQAYWRLIEARWLDEAAAQGRHHIYVEALDEQGQRIVGQEVTVFWPDGSATGVTENKPAPEYAYSFPMGAVGPAYSVRIGGLPGDTLHGAGLGSPAQRHLAILTSFQLKFQRTIQP